MILQMSDEWLDFLIKWFSDKGLYSFSHCAIIRTNRWSIVFYKTKENSDVKITA